MLFGYLITRALLRLPDPRRPVPVPQHFNHRREHRAGDPQNDPGVPLAHLAGRAVSLPARALGLWCGRGRWRDP